MKKYELFLVLPGTFDENEVSEKIQEIMAILAELSQNAEIKPLGKNRLAYPIKQVRYGYFYTVQFETDSEKVKLIEEKLRLARGLLRSIIYLYNKKLDGAEKIAYFSQFSNLTNEAEQTEEAKKSEEQVSLKEKDEKTTEEVEEQEVLSETIKTEKIEEKNETEEITPEPKKIVEKKIDLEEIDKKLDKILSDEDINI